MPLPRAPPAGAAAGPSKPVCGLCHEEAEEADSDLVEVFCNQGDCLDAAGRRYHRDCMLSHIDKSGRVRKTHGGHNEKRQIAYMELSGTARGRTLAGVACALAAPLTARGGARARLPLRALSPRG